MKRAGTDDFDAIIKESIPDKRACTTDPFIEAVRKIREKKDEEHEVQLAKIIPWSDHLFTKEAIAEAAPVIVRDIERQIVFIEEHTSEHYVGRRRFPLRLATNCNRTLRAALPNVPWWKAVCDWNDAIDRLRMDKEHDAVLDKIMQKIDMIVVRAWTSAHGSATVESTYNRLLTIHL